jgi:hypothetical protein
MLPRHQLVRTGLLGLQLLVDPYPRKLLLPITMLLTVVVIAMAVVHLR